MKKHKYFNFIITLITLLGVFTFLFSNILNKPVGNLDELWNYNTARQIMNGLVPYKDISMITTPLLPTIIAIILKITADELIVFRILTAIFSTIIIYMSYKVLEVLLKNKLLSSVLAGLITYIYYKEFMLDYNFIVLIITLIIIYLELKRLELKGQIIEKDSYKFEFLIGMLAGLAICTKQTVGIFISIGVVLVKLLFVNNKLEFKQYIKNALVRCMGIIIPCIILLGFLIISGGLKYFIDYALLGIKTFSNSIPYTVLIKDEKLVIKFLAIILPIFLLTILVYITVTIMQKKSSSIIQKIKVITVYSAVMLIIMYPISDKVHFLIATLPLLIELLYIIFTLLKKIYDKDKLKYKKIIVPTIGIICILIMFTTGSITIYKNINEYISAKKEEEEFLKNGDGHEKLAHYNNVIVPSYITIRAETIKELMNNNDKKVIVLDADAVVFNIPYNVYYKNYSMFLKGNIGKDGEDGIIEDIKNSSNCLYIVKKEGIRLNWQTPTKVIEYVRKNLQKQGEIDACEIYSSNK